MLCDITVTPLPMNLQVGDFKYVNVHLHVQSHRLVPTSGYIVVVTQGQKGR